ncbi:hypothetical protein VH571_16415 [Frondihabitans sp. 4ASC-45]|uniref:hypothetical protein n=1 Tax=Frondihabitans sp. 4ASC-45 TaxID=3111636 RepID=UPI003C24CD1E
MPRTHGFRIYIVEAFPNQIKGKVPFDTSVGSSARDAVLRMLDKLHQRGTIFVQPQQPADEEVPRKPTSSVTVGNPEVIRDGLVHVVVETGETGSHTRATKPGEQSQDIHDWSPEASHYITLLFSQSEESRFVVVAQAVRRRDPVRKLMSLLAKESAAEKVAAKAEEEAARGEAVANGETPPKRRSHTRLLFNIVQAADNSYIDGIIGAAVSANATFRSIGESDRGGPRDPYERTLQIRLLNDKGREVIRTAGRGWARRQRSGQAASQAEGVAELAALLEAEDLLEEEEAARYDDATISVRDRDGESTTIAVDTLRDVFTYPVSDGSPTTAFYYARVAPRLEIVMREERLDISPISVSEVEEWLNG